MIVFLSWTLENAADLAAIVGTGVAVVGFPALFLTLWATFRSLSQAEHSLRFTVYTQTLDELEKHRPVRRKLEEQLRQPGGFNFDALPKEQQDSFDDLARAYDRVGLLVKHGTVPRQFLFDFYSRPVIVAWDALESHIQNEREIRPQPGHMKKFELLAQLARHYREKEKPSTEVLSDWNNIWDR